jgi:hypothetical protein
MICIRLNFREKMLYRVALYRICHQLLEMPKEALDNLGLTQWRHDAARVVTGEDRRKGGFSEVP